jgi:hypothetical protein
MRSAEQSGTTVVCGTHRRRVQLSKRSRPGAPRVDHLDGGPCSSQKFWVRRTFEGDRQQAAAALLNEVD